MRKYHNKLLVLPEENRTILLMNDKRFVIKCDKRDKFDYKIGIGLALQKYYEDMMVDMLDKILPMAKYLKNTLTTKQLAEYYLYYHYNNDIKLISNLFNRVEREQNQYYKQLVKYEQTKVKNKILQDNLYLGDLEKPIPPKHKFIKLVGGK